MAPVPRRPLLGALLFGACALSTSGVAHAQPAPNIAPPAADQLGPFDVRWQVDAPVTLTTFLIGAVPYLFPKELAGPHCGLACDPNDVNALDRTVIGNHAPWANDVSNYLLYGSVAYPLLFDFLDVTITGPRDRESYAGFGRDTLVMGEVLSVNLALNTVVKFAVARPRPLVYDPTFSDAERLNPDSGLSFFSGHSSTTFAMATAYSYLFTLRHPNSPLVAPMWILTEGTAALTAGLRVAAGMHFWTDVLTGGAIGVAIGALVPYLHTRVKAPASLPGVGQLQLRVLPTEVPGGAGIAIALQ
ncbi:MAG: phosphatase PAP2 family protein [Polyangiaceae bacterium]